MARMREETRNKFYLNFIYKIKERVLDRLLPGWMKK